MPLLLQARITSVSFEEARYRHYRSKQRREGALRKAADEVRQRAPSPFDEDAAHATRRLFARTVAQVVEIHVVVLVSLLGGACPISMPLHFSRIGPAPF